MKSCPKCGSQNTLEAQTCAYCGMVLPQMAAAPQPPFAASAGASAPTARYSSAAQAGVAASRGSTIFGLGVASLAVPFFLMLIFWPLAAVVAIVLGPIAAGMGHMERGRIQRGEAPPDDRVNSGWIMGLIATALGGIGMFATLYFVVLIGSLMASF